MSKKRKKNINELTAASKFVDAFFKGISDNTADRMIQKAKKARMEREAIEKMEKIQRQKKELEDILADIPKARAKRD